MSRIAPAIHVRDHLESVASLRFVAVGHQTHATTVVLGQLGKRAIGSGLSA